MPGHDPGTPVLVRATVTADGRCVVVAPGVELPIGAVHIAAELPACAPDAPVGIVLMFETPGDLREFVETFEAGE